MLAESSFSFAQQSQQQLGVAGAGALRYVIALPLLLLLAEQSLNTPKVSFPSVDGDHSICQKFY